MIRERFGLEIDEIFRDKGEGEFRRLEQQIVEELPPERDLVLSTGGGLVLNERAMEILRVQGPIFWLQVDKADVLERCQRPWAAKRPLLNGAQDLEKEIERLMEERNPLYGRYGAPVPGGFAHPRDAGKHILDLLSRRSDFRVYFVGEESC
jgi:shikimate kinase